jgi:hypothetical protein
VRAALEMEHAREADKLRRDRAHLERQSRVLAKIPTRKDRAEIEALEAVVEQAKRDSKAKDARHKLTIERLRRQIVTLQVCCCAPLIRVAGCYLYAVPYSSAFYPESCSQPYHSPLHALLSRNICRAFAPGTVA